MSEDTKPIGANELYSTIRELVCRLSITPNMKQVVSIAQDCGAGDIFDSFCLLNEFEDAAKEVNAHLSKYKI